MHTFKARKGKEDIPRVVASGKAITAREIPNYCNEYFYSVMEKYQFTKYWGLANGNGWANEPFEYLDAITAIESEDNRIQAEEMEKNNPKKATDAKDSMRKHE
jgi:hypothetical protein